MLFDLSATKFLFRGVIRHFPVCLGLSLALYTTSAASAESAELAESAQPDQPAQPDQRQIVQTDSPALAQFPSETDLPTGAALPVEVAQSVLAGPAANSAPRSGTTQGASCVARCDPGAMFHFRPPADLAPLAGDRPIVTQPVVTQPVTQPVTPAIAATKRSTSGYGMVQISNPPRLVPAPVSDSEYQAPLPGTPAAPAQLQTGRRAALTQPILRIQGVYVYQGDESSARARFSGVYPLSPNVQVGGSIDITTGPQFNDRDQAGVSINELYLAASLRDIPNLRFVVGQLDLTSYFDRNSFAKDGASQFFNPVFQTNPALVAAGIGSRPGALVNWSITDALEARAAVFSSDRSISDFSLDGFAGEIGLRLGSNFIVRGTYATGRDGGANTGFQEVFSVNRGNGFGLQEGDREEAYGVNAELFIPSLSMGLFGRYGHYENREIGLGGDTFVFGLSFLDLFMADDRLGLGYGRELSNDRLRRAAGDSISDVAEIFYDVKLFPNLRLGFTFQMLDGFSESIAGVRIRTDFDLMPRRTP